MITYTYPHPHHSAPKFHAEKANAAASGQSSDGGSSPANTTMSAKKKKFDPVKKASNAVKAAKQRCTNPKNPDYPSYGGKGIKFLLTCDKLVAAIGLPKSPDVSLDRIDAGGHYEIGNVRWTNKHVQAANKKTSLSTKSGELELLKVQAVEKSLEERRTITRLWGIGITANNLHRITGEDRDVLDTLYLAGDPFEASFKLGAFKDWGLPPGIFSMPSLTCPGQSVRIRGGAWRNPTGDNSGDATRAVRNGVVVGLGYVDPHFNISEHERNAVNAACSNDKAGLMWLGRPSTASAMHYPVEGRMLAVASRLFVKWRQSAAIYPIVTILELLKDAGYAMAVELDSHPLLNVRFLFVPDLQVDHGEGWSLDAYQASHVLRLLEYRRKHGLKTFLGVQKLERVPKTLLGFLARQANFDRLYLGTFPVVQVPAPTNVWPSQAMA